jgi:uncharacterized protein YidB (DUF937 family)
MGLFDTLLGSLAGKSDTAAGQDPLAAALGALLVQNGGLQGLMTKFSHGGLGEIFSSWIGTGQNQSVSQSQLQSVLGPDQIRALAARLGVSPDQASGFLAEHLPKIVDKLTPSGQIDPGADHEQGLMALLPALLQRLGGESRQV